MSRRSPEFMDRVSRVQDSFNCSFIEAVKQVQAYERQHPGEIEAAPGRKAAERKHNAGIVANWNAKHPAGTRVGVRILSGGREYETTTRSEAWQLGHGEPVVLIEGRAGGWGLDFVRVLADGETLPPLPEKGAVAA